MRRPNLEIGKLLTYEVCIRRQCSQADEAYRSNKCARRCVQRTTKQVRCQWEESVHPCQRRSMTHELKRSADQETSRVTTYATA